MVVHSSTQHPTEVQHKVAHALHLPMSSVRVEVRRMGGGHEIDPVQPQAFQRLAGQPHVPDMGRVEAAAEQPDGAGRRRGRGEPRGRARGRPVRGDRRRLVALADQAEVDDAHAALARELDAVDPLDMLGQHHAVVHLVDVVAAEHQDHVGIFVGDDVERLVDGVGRALERDVRQLDPGLVCEQFDGQVDEGYGKVADAFRANFAAGREVGAALAVYRDGVKVVDLWGGYRNGETKTPWRGDTMVNLFSTTKGIAALTIAHAMREPMPRAIARPRPP